MLDAVLAQEVAGRETRLTGTDDDYVDFAHWSHSLRHPTARLDDGAWRFTTRTGETLTDVLPGFTRPMAESARLGSARISLGS
jgi:hypothetical protein